MSGSPIQQCLMSKSADCSCWKVHGSIGVMVSFETIRFPLIFGGFLVAAASAYVFREKLIPDMEDERRKIFRGSEENRKAIQDAVKSMRPS